MKIGCSGRFVGREIISVHLSENAKFSLKRTSSTYECFVKHTQNFTYDVQKLKY